MTNFQVLGRPHAKISSIAAWQKALDYRKTIFDYIGPYDQGIVVPMGETSIILDAWGASSGNDATWSGRGAYGRIEIDGLVGGTLLIARVAGMSSGVTGGWPGGGNAGPAMYTGSHGNGGGGVTLVMKPPYSFPADVILAVPGGGGEAIASTSGAPAHGRGGDADMTTAQNGQMANGWPSAGDPTGKGATHVLNGPASPVGGGGAGSDYQGGNGVGTNVSGIGGSSSGGGGAGAKSGGAGGATFVVNGHAAGGGGGAGLIVPSYGVSLLTSTSGARLGDGRIILIAPPPNPPALVSSATFNFTGAVQTWVVPSGVTSVVVELIGAQGGGTNGGRGGFLRFRMPVTPGETLYIYVGGKGNTFNGGGACRWNGIGGGATDIRRGGSAVANRVGVAGGGGGEGNPSAGPGSPAGLLSAPGAYFLNNSSQASRSTWTANGGAMGSAGVNEIGGAGGVSGFSAARDGGGGGGGYKAGSGGAAGNSSNNGGGGGGGTGWFSSVCTELDYADAFNTGNGSCIILW